MSGQRQPPSPGQGKQVVDVSIIVIAYNEAERIGECLRALLAQETGLAFEAIVVDDGSSDGTAAVVSRQIAVDSRLRCIRLDANEGRGAARRAGIAAARGVDVGFVDADIIVPPTWLEQLAADVPKAAAVSGIAVPDGDVAPLARIFRLRPRVVPGSATITGNNVLFDGTVLRATPFPETRLGEDFRLAQILRADGRTLRARRDVLVEHRERKSYRQAFRWLFDSGVDATSLLVEYRRFRLPDIVAITWLATLVVSLVLAVLLTPWLALVPALATVVIAVVHVATRFRPWPRILPWLGAATADVPLVGAYLVGRVVGLFGIGRHAGAPGAGTRVQQAAADPLARGSVNLVSNNVLATGLGLVSWTVTTRLWPAAEVGVAGATISAATLAASLAMLGVQGTIMRWMPTATDGRALMATGLAVTIPVAVVLGVVVGLLQGPALGVGVARGLGFAIFLLLVVGLVFRGVLEASMIAVRDTGTVLRANVGGSGVKIAAAAVLGAAATGTAGIVFTALLATATASAVLVRGARARRILAGPRQFSSAVVRSLHRYSLTFYLNGLIGAVPVLVLPILVRSQLGDDKAAYWYIASLMAMALFQVPAAVGTALLVEGAHRRGELRILVLRSTAGLALVMVPIISVAILVAPWVLGLFGADYVDQSTGPFRILAVSGLLVSASYVLGDVLLVRLRLVPLMVLNLVNAVVVLGLALQAATLDAVAWAWFAGEGANVVMFAILIPFFLERTPAREMAQP